MTEICKTFMPWQIVYDDYVSIAGNKMMPTAIISAVRHTVMLACMSRKVMRRGLEPMKGL